MQLTTQQKIKSIFSWIDNNILLLLSGFLLAFIPLYPKIPLWSPIEQYIVRVRLEDVVIGVTALVWAVQFLRKKIQWQSKLTWMIGAYIVVSFLSVLSAMFITKTVPLQPLHVGKTLLHFFRYIEYFAMFFFLLSAVKRPSDAKKLMIIFALTVIGISVYGFGQKYYYWPVYSTMNREFSKGIRLYLTPHARVQSTFAGHYDMAAFLVIALPLLLALAYKIEDWRLKFLFHTSFWLGTWLLIASASRTSFLAYLVALVFAIFITGITQAGKWKKAGFILTRSFFVLGVTFVMFLALGEDLQERLAQVLDSNPRAKAAYDQFNKQRSDIWDKYIVHKQAGPPANSISTDEAIAQGVLTPTDEVPAPTRPSDVYQDIPDKVLVATVSASGSTTMTTVEQKRVFSPCALENGLSLCIRLETLWPRAIKGFLRNPLLGSGYATLNKEAVGQFTEAESTDNNFLRTLGETGLFGFLSFYGCVVVLMYWAAKSFNSQDKMKSALAIGLFCSSIGLLLNAVYIDVFASSKVAQTYWELAGIFFAYLVISHYARPKVQMAHVSGTSTEMESSMLSVRKATKKSKKKSAKKKKK
jgi:hypothetical protein